MRRALTDTAWFAILIAAGLAAIWIDARFGFSTVLALLVGRPM